MKNEEEMGRDRELPSETDDEDNEARRHSDIGRYWPSSSTGGSYQSTWPQSYRQSIDLMTNIPSHSVRFLTSSGFILVGSSFFKHPPPPLPEEPPAVTKPLISAPSYDHSEGAYPFGPQDSSKFSFGRPSYYNLPPSPQCSMPQAIANGINVLCGVGILSTPYAVKEGGWLGLLLLIAFGCISCYTGVLLKRCLDSSPELQTYPDIGQAAFGMVGRICISIVLYLELYANCVQFITLVGDSLSSMFPDVHNDFMGFDLSSEEIFAIMAGFLVLPTVWLKNLSLLSYLSAGDMVASPLVIMCLFWVGAKDQVGFRPGGTVLDLANLPVALGIYASCYSGHSVFPNIYSSLEKKEQFPLVLMFSFILCTVLFAGVAAAGYLMFGESVESLFTLNMPHKYLASKIAIWTMVVNPLSQYALTMTPVALSIEELLPSNQQSYFTIVTIRTLLVISTLVAALNVPFFGFVMAFLGSSLTMLVALILPCACYLSILRKSVNFLEVGVCILIILMGITCAGVGSYTSIKQIAADYRCERNCE